MRSVFSNSNANIDKKIFFLVPYIDSLDSQNFITKDSVLTWTELLTRAHPDEAKAFAMNGDFLFYSQKLDQARVNYRKSLNLRSDVYDVWIKMFYIDADLRQYDSLKEISYSAIELFPNQPFAYYFNGIALKNLNENEEAVRVLKRALPLTVSNLKLRSDIYTTLGDTYHVLKNYQESDNAYEESLKLNPDNPYTLNNYAYYLSLRNENLQKAEQMSLRSIELAPDNSSLEDTYAWILFQQGKYDDAKKWLEKAMQHGGDKSSVIIEHYGDVLFKLGDTDKAVEYWQKAKQAGEASNLIDRKINDRMFYE
jgi:tetratricopeptide (TPR) repeat protein